MTTIATNIEQRELPEGWQWVKLGDVCKEDKRIIKGDSLEAQSLPYLSLEHVGSETGKVLDSALIKSAVDAGKNNTFYFDEDHILYGKLRPYLNKVAQPDFAGRCTTELVPLKPINFDRDYLWRLLKRPETVSYAMMTSTGTRMPRTNMGAFMGMPIPFPPPRERKRIVKVLSSIDESINKIQAEESRLTRLQKAITNELLSGQTHVPESIG